MHALFLTLFAIVSLRVKCHRTVTHNSLESMQTQRGHFIADLVHVLNVNAKILLSCVEAFAREFVQKVLCSLQLFAQY